MFDLVDRGSKRMPGAAFSIDIEDWFHVHNLEAVVARDTWDGRELRVERNTGRMLELMAERGARCSCFVLGLVAEKCPRLIGRIAAAGHELATRGYGHQLLYTLSPAAFRKDVTRGIGLVEAAGGPEGPRLSSTVPQHHRLVPRLSSRTRFGVRFVRLSDRRP